MTPEQAWSAARSRTVALLPFFGYLSFQLEHQADASIPTACTNGKVVKYNPAFVLGLTPECRITLLAHEILHCAQGHVFRRGERDPKISNLAADQEVDWILEKMNIAVRVKGGNAHKAKDEPFTWPPAELGHPPPNPKYEGWAYERIYDDMLQEQKQKEQEQKDDSSTSPGGGNTPDQGEGEGLDPKKGDRGFGEFEEFPGSEAERTVTEAKWKNAVASSAKLCQARGSMPDALERMVAQIIDPPISLEEQLRAFYIDRVREDYSWARPNRRYTSSGFYLPSLDSRRMGEVVLACDSSGSITNEDWTQFVALVNHVVADVMPSKTTVVVCDDAIHQVTEFDQGEEVVPGKIRNLGGGGTSFEPVFEHVAKQDMSPVCLIYFTDLYGSFPSAPPDYPVLWVTKSEGMEVPFGQIVRFP